MTSMLMCLCVCVFVLAKKALFWLGETSRWSKSVPAIFVEFLNAASVHSTHGARRFDFEHNLHICITQHVPRHGDACISCLPGEVPCCRKRHHHTPLFSICIVILPFASDMHPSASDHNTSRRGSNVGAGDSAAHMSELVDAARAELKRRLSHGRSKSYDTRELLNAMRSASMSAVCFAVSRDLGHSELLYSPIADRSCTIFFMLTLSDKRLQGVDSAALRVPPDASLKPSVHNRVGPHLR